VSRRDDLRDIDLSIRQVGRIGRSREAARRRAELSGVELSNPAAAILSALCQRGPMRSSVLAEAADTEPPLVSRELRALVERGYITNEPDPTDGRARIVSITRKGRTAYERFRTATDDITARAFEGWTNDDIHTLSSLLRRMVSDFAKAPPDR
jgi:DNA-binding MarR family transcriptional regulator